MTSSFRYSRLPSGQSGFQRAATSSTGKYESVKCFRLTMMTFSTMGRLSAYLPLLKHKLFIQPVAGFRMLDAQPQSKDFTLSYFSLHINGRLSSNWTLFGGFTHSYGDSVDTSLLDLGLRYRW